MQRVEMFVDLCWTTSFLFAVPATAWVNVVPNWSTWILPPAPQSQTCPSKLWGQRSQMHTLAGYAKRFFWAKWLCLCHFSEGCPLLEQLNISWCDQVTKDGIQALMRCCPGLKGLFLKGCTQVILCFQWQIFTCSVCATSTPQCCSTKTITNNF